MNLERLEEHVSVIREDLATIKATLSSQHEVLKEHMSRTKASEERLDKLEVPYKVIAWVGVPLGVVVAVMSIVSRFF